MLLPDGLRRREAIPHEDETIRAGDPDDDSLANEYVGEDLPGGSTPTPDQCNVDEIGRAYGLQDEDNGSLRTSSEVLARRDPAAPRAAASRAFALVAAAIMVLSCRPLAPRACRPRPRACWPVDLMEIAERLRLAGEETSGRAR